MNQNTTIMKKRVKVSIYGVIKKINFPKIVLFEDYPEDWKLIGGT